MENKIGVCIAGYGNFGKKLHSYLVKMPDVDVKYLYHPDPERSVLYGPLGESDFAKIAKDQNVKTCVIAAPYDQQFVLCWLALNAGKNVFVEKPMSDSYDALLNLADKISDKVFMVGHCQRREGVFRKAKELLNNNAIGKVVNVNFNFSHGGAFTISPNNWRAKASRNDLGPLAMLGSHCLDTVHYLFGNVAAVYAQFSNLSGRTEAPDISSVVLNLESGATVFLQSNYIVPSEKYCLIAGTEGAIYIDNGRIWLRPGRDRQEGAKFIRIDKEELEISKVDPIEEELREFITAIQNGTKVETGYQEGLAVVKILEACRESWSTGRPIAL